MHFTFAQWRALQGNFKTLAVPFTRFGTVAVKHL